MRYALIKNGIVENVIEANESFIQHIEAEYDAVVASDEASKGDLYDAVSGSFTKKPSDEIFLEIKLDKEIAMPNELVTATATISDGNGVVVPVDGTYFVRIVNPAGATAKLLKVVFVAGKATSQFSLVEPDIYTIDMDSIHPKPQAVLRGDVRLIVAE